MLEAAARAQRHAGSVLPVPSNTRVSGSHEGQPQEQDALVRIVLALGTRAFACWLAALIKD